MKGSIIIAVASMALASCQLTDVMTEAERASAQDPTTPPEEVAAIEQTATERATDTAAAALSPFLPPGMAYPLAALGVGFLFRRPRRVVWKLAGKAMTQPTSIPAELLRLPLQIAGLLDSERSSAEYLQAAEDAAWREKDYDLVKRIAAARVAPEVQA